MPDLPWWANSYTSGRLDPGAGLVARGQYCREICVFSLHRDHREAATGQAVAANAVVGLSWTPLGVQKRVNGQTHFQWAVATLADVAV